MVAPNPNAPADPSPSSAATPDLLPALPAVRRPSRKAEGKRRVPDRACSRAEKRFAQLVAQGWPMHRCYTEATGAIVAKRNHAEVQAWRWRMRPAVEAEIIRARAALTEATAMTRAEKRNILGNVARSEETPPNVAVSAIAVDNRMTGDDDAGLQGRLSGGAGGRVTITLDLFAANGGGEAREDTAGEINVTPKIP